MIRLERAKFKVSDMKKQKFTETQIASVIKQYEGGREAMDICREYGISKATLYNWRKKYAGMDSSHIKELKALQEENRRRKQMYAELMPDHQLAKHIIEKKF
jgi:putative transposase